MCCFFLVLFDCRKSLISSVADLRLLAFSAMTGSTTRAKNHSLKDKTAGSKLSKQPGKCSLKLQSTSSSSMKQVVSLPCKTNLHKSLQKTWNSCKRHLQPAAAVVFGVVFFLRHDSVRFALIRAASAGNWAEGLLCHHLNLDCSNSVLSFTFEHSAKVVNEGQQKPQCVHKRAIFQQLQPKEDADSAWKDDHSGWLSAPERTELSCLTESSVESLKPNQSTQMPSESTSIAPMVSQQH